MTLQAPNFLLHEITVPAFILHVGAGAVSLVSGTVAAFAPKGGRLHRRAGTLFVISMLVMATFAVCLAIAIPDQIVNVFIGILVLYLAATGWLTVHRPEGTTGISERIAVFVAFCLFAPFGVLSFHLATGLTPVVQKRGAVQRPCPHRDLLLYVCARARGDRRRQSCAGRRRLGRATYCAASVAYVPGAYTGNGFGIHQRIRAVPARPSPCATGLLPSPVAAVVCWSFG